MKHWKIFGLFLALCIGFAEPGAAQQPLDGIWVGGFDTGNGFWAIVNVHFKTDQEGLKGTIDLPISNQIGLPLENLTFASPNIHFEFQGRNGRAIYQGRISDGTISGEFQQAERRGVFKLARGATYSLKMFEPYYGDYQLGPDKFIWIGGLHEIGGKPAFVESWSGRSGVLYPSSEASFYSGPETYDPFPVDVGATFVKNERGEVTGVTWHHGSSPSQFAKRVRLYTEERVTYHNGDVKIAGTLLKPVGKGAYPAVVFIHGSGELDRTYFSSISTLLANHGIAALVYDKRGVGDSTGDWTKSGFIDLARDALAGVGYLQTRNDINPAQVGLYGHSQGGWIAPLAASLSRDVAFVIIAAGAADSPEEQDQDRIEYQMRADRFSEEDIRQALALNSLRFEVLHGHADVEKFLSFLKRIEKRPWASYVANPNSFEQVMVWKIYEYDPKPILEKLSTPILALFGGLDRIVPPERNVRKMAGALKKAGNKNYKIKVFPGVGHDFQDATTGGRKDYLHRKGYAPDFLNTITRWVGRRFESCSAHHFS